VKAEEAIAQIDSLLGRAGLHPGDPAPWKQFEELGDSQREAIITSWLAGIERLTPARSTYGEQADRIKELYGGHEASNVELLAGVLNALRDDIEAGYTLRVAALIHADVFGDFLEMAEELLSKNYKDAAAVIVGSVLEEHLRKLGESAQIAVYLPDGKARKADTINADLVKAGSYNKLEQKSVTAWLGLRNDAAHGHYENYTAEQVAQMVAGVRDFMIRNPA
jgi:hypothetical protein